MLKESFLKYLRFEKNYSDDTIVSYGTDLSKFEEYFKTVDENLDFAAVDADIVRGWVLSLMEGGCTATTVNRKLSSLRSFYRYLLRQGVVSVDPLMKVTGPKKKKPLPVFVKDADMARLLDDTAFDAGFEGVRDRLILEMFYETGIRRSELINLTDADVDLYAKQIKVTGKRNKQRLIPFGDELKEDIEAYLSAKKDFLPDGGEAFFVRKNGKALYPYLVYLLVKRNLSKVVSLKKRSPHVLRHTFATSMLNNHAELEAVKELLGHESLTTTEVYTHTTFEELKKVYEQAHPRA
jgi:integrase/recombinase XerC